MDDEGFESAFIETLITQQDKQPTYIFASLPTPNPIVYQSDYRGVTNDIEDIQKTYKCVYKKQYGSKLTNQLFKLLNLNDLQTPTITQTQNQLLFDSNFINGNLAAVYQVDSFEYDLLLQEDFNTTSYSQWFYFRITNPTDNKYRINIINLTKNYLQYQNGFGVYIKINSNWEVLKSQVLIKESEYVKSNFCKTISNKLYTISFWINKSFNTCEIALGIPYSHLDLDRYGQTKFYIQKINNYFNFLNIKTLLHSYTCLNFKLKSLPIPFQDYLLKCCNLDPKEVMLFQQQQDNILERLCLLMYVKVFLRHYQMIKHYNYFITQLQYLWLILMELNGVILDVIQVEEI